MRLLVATCTVDYVGRLGCKVEHDLATATVTIDVPAKIGHKADYDLVRKMRASISVLGPLVARCGEADIALPGGDAIGSRGLDIHMQGLEKLGCHVHSEHGYLIIRAENGLSGANIALDFPSVGATENVVIDKKVIGGVAVRVGDEVIDGTVANRLAQVRRQLAG